MTLIKVHIELFANNTRLAIILEKLIEHGIYQNNNPRLKDEGDKIHLALCLGPWGLGTVLNTHSLAFGGSAVCIDLFSLEWLHNFLMGS
jgi:hypothetical protein